MEKSKYFLAIYGSNRDSICRKAEKLVKGNVEHTKEANSDFFVNQVYDTGIPDEPVWENNIGLLLHGIVFPEEISIDALSLNRYEFLKNLIRKHQQDVLKIPLAIRNGSYAGVLIDGNKKTFYAFTSFLNSFPVYYSLYNNVLLVSNNLYLIALLTDSTIDGVNTGMLEYYFNGTNLTDKTVLGNIKSIPKGGYLKYSNGSVNIGYYYRMPVEESSLSFSEHVDAFAELWKQTVSSLHSTKYPYGLGLTGGIDSRLILSEFPDKNVPLLFTGSHPEHPDVILARQITKSLGLQHTIEDYRNADDLTGYVKYCAMADNPTHCNGYYSTDQIKFRQANGLVYEMSGLTEFIGGVYHYSDRRNIRNAINMSMPIKRHRIDDYTEFELITMGLRNVSYIDDLRQEEKDSVLSLYPSLFKHLKEQIGDVPDVESFLERFRHIHKMTNLLKWVVLPGRVSNENVSPSMNIEVTDFTCRINLKHRQNRKLILAYLKRYHPEIAKFVLSGYVFSAKSPWIVYKIFAHHVNNLNHLGIKIPFMQPYIRKHDYGKKKAESQKRIQDFQRAVCKKSSLLATSEFQSLFVEYQNDPNRLMRLFNLALCDMKIKHKGSLESYLMSIAEEYIA